MIATAIGIPKPSAPKIARTNSESTFTWCRTPDDDMTLLLGAPRASARPKMNNQLRLWAEARSDSIKGNAGALWLTSS
jgi:hypothetical protein